MNVSLEAPISHLTSDRLVRPVVPRWSLFALGAASCLALGISTYLTIVALRQGTVAGCAADGVWDCSHVLTSKWSKWLGIPVSLAAASLYTALLGALFFLHRSVPTRVRYAAWSIVTALACAAGLAAAWFISLQVFVLGHFCSYCMVAHTCGLIAFAVVLAVRPLATTTTWKLAGIGVGAVSVLMVGQYLTPTPPTYVILEHVAEDNASAEDALELDLDVLPFDELTLEDETLQGVGAQPEDGDDVIDTSITVPQTDAGGVLTHHHGLNLTSATQSEAVVADLPLIPVGQDAIERGVTQSSKPAPQPSFTPLPSPEESSTADADAEIADAVRKPVEPPSEVRFPRLNSSLRVHQWPRIGSSETPHAAILMFDYTCGHCRQMSQHMEAAHTMFGDQLAVIYMPVPLHPSCNDTVTQLNRKHAEACELARAAVAVWYADPSAFEAYHRWLFQPGSPPSAAAARAYAEKLVGTEKFSRAVQSEAVEKFIRLHVQLYKRAGRGTLPKLITTAGPTIEGTMSSSNEVCQRLQSTFGLTRP